MRVKLAVMFVLFGWIAVVPGFAQGSWKVVRTMPVGGEGGWDYLSVDSQTHRLYVPRSTHTQVIDAESGKVIADIPGQKRAHGVALVPEMNRGFISDGGGSGAIVVFDLKTNQTLGTIAAQPDADGIIYDPFSKRVLVVSGDGNTLMTLKPDIDLKSGKIEEPITLGGAPEFLAVDGKGKAYINLENKNEVAVVDLAARKVLSRWPVAPGGAPVGMSIDTIGKHLFIGCRKPAKLIVMSTENGKVEADFPIGPGVDATKFDNGEAFSSSGDGTLAVAAEKSGKFELAQTVNTPRGARTMGIDTRTHTIFLPTAQMEEPRPGSNGRPTPKPDSFMIVVVGR